MIMAMKFTTRDVDNDSQHVIPLCCGPVRVPGGIGGWCGMGQPKRHIPPYTPYRRSTLGFTGGSGNTIIIIGQIIITTLLKLQP